MIHDRHWQEWLSSGVAERIIELNVESLDDPTDIDKALNRNIGKRWQHWKGGPGWWVCGLDPQSSERTFLGGQFKPDTAMLNGTKQDGSPKYKKYESPAGDEAYPLFLEVEQSDYWQQVLADKLKPIVITEGAKKAGALLTCGYAAVSISGVWNGQKLGRIHPLLEAFFHLGRPVYLAFDSDLASNVNVYRAMDQLARLMAQGGCVPYVVLWDEAYKGIDDYLVAHDAEAVQSAIAQALSFSEWKKARPDDRQVSHTLDPKDEVSDTTFENHIYQRLFESGRGGWVTIDDAFYKYSGTGFWKPLHDKEVLKLISEQSRKAYKVRGKADGSISVQYPFATDRGVRSSFSFCRNILDTAGDLPNNNHLLCFRNGTVDLRTGELTPHKPEHYLTTSVTADYKPNEGCPDVFYDFICSAYGPELLEVVRAVTSMLLDPTANYGQFVHLIGESGSGKGTLLRLWGEMFGLNHYRSGSNLAELSTPEGRHQNLTGVRLYAVPDCGGYIQGLKPWYELVDNGPMSGRALFSASAYQKTWHTRFVIASVDQLQIENAGDGWDRRCIPLPTFPRRSRNPDPTLFTRLVEAKGQIISWALALGRKEREFILSNLRQYDRIDQAKSDASVSGDPVRYFVDLCLRPTESKQQVQSHQLHSWYEAFCLVHGYQKMSMSKFIFHMKTILNRHFVPRKNQATKDSPTQNWKHRGKAPAHWINMEPIEGAFEKISDDGDLFRCVKYLCEEGGIQDFAEFDNEFFLSNATAGTAGTGFNLENKTTLSPLEHNDNGSLEDRGQRGQRGQGVLIPSQNSCVISITRKNSEMGVLEGRSVVNGNPENGFSDSKENIKRRDSDHTIFFTQVDTPPFNVSQGVPAQNKATSSTYIDEKDEEWAKDKPDGYIEEF